MRFTVPLVDAPDLDAVTDKPFDHKRCFILASPQAVAEEHQQDVKGFLERFGADVHDRIPLIGRYLIAGNAAFVHFLAKHPILMRIDELLAGLALQRNVRLGLIR